MINHPVFVILLFGGMLLWHGGGQLIRKLALLGIVLWLAMNMPHVAP